MVYELEYKILDSDEFDYIVFCDRVTSDGEWLMFWDKTGTLVHACSSKYIKLVNKVNTSQ